MVDFVYSSISVLNIVVKLVCDVSDGSSVVLRLLLSGMVVWWMFIVSLCLCLLN